MGAVANLSGEELENRPIASVGMGLQGLIPNLNITIPIEDNRDVLTYIASYLQTSSERLRGARRQVENAF